MRIEGLSDTTGGNLSNRAYEQLRAMRAAMRASKLATAQSQTATSPAELPAPAVRTPTPQPQPQPQPPLPTVADMDPRAVFIMKPTPPSLIPKIDVDADGWINTNDLPFDYFQLVRRTTFRPRPMDGDEDKDDTNAAAGM